MPTNYFFLLLVCLALLSVQECPGIHWRDFSCVEGVWTSMRTSISDDIDMVGASYVFMKPVSIRGTLSVADDTNATFLEDTTLILDFAELSVVAKDLSLDCAFYIIVSESTTRYTPIIINAVTGSIIIESRPHTDLRNSTVLLVRDSDNYIEPETFDIITNSRGICGRADWVPTSDGDTIELVYHEILCGDDSSTPTSTEGELCKGDHPFFECDQGVWMGINYTSTEDEFWIDGNYNLEGETHFEYPIRFEKATAVFDDDVYFSSQVYVVESDLSFLKRVHFADVLELLSFTPYAKIQIGECPIFDESAIIAVEYDFDEILPIVNQELMNWRDSNCDVLTPILNVRSSTKLLVGSLIIDNKRLLLNISTESSPTPGEGEICEGDYPRFECEAGVWYAYDFNSTLDPILSNSIFEFEGNMYIESDAGLDIVNSKIKADQNVFQSNTIRISNDSLIEVRMSWTVNAVEPAPILVFPEMQTTAQDARIKVYGCMENLDKLTLIINPVGEIVNDLFVPLIEWTASCDLQVVLPKLIVAPSDPEHCAKVMVSDSRLGFVLVTCSEPTSPSSGSPVTTPTDSSEMLPTPASEGEICEGDYPDFECESGVWMAANLTTTDELTLGPQKFRFVGYSQIIHTLRLDGSDVLFDGEVVVNGNIVLSGNSILRSTGNFVGIDCKITLHDLIVPTTHPLIRVGGNISFAPSMFVLIDLSQGVTPSQPIPLLGVYGETEGVDSPRIDLKTEENLCADSEHTQVKNNFTLYVKLYDCFDYTPTVTPSSDPTEGDLCEGSYPDFECLHGVWFASDYTISEAQSWDSGKFRFAGVTTLSQPLRIVNSSVYFEGDVIMDDTLILDRARVLLNQNLLIQSGRFHVANSRKFLDVPITVESCVMGLDNSDVLIELPTHANTNEPINILKWIGTDCHVSEDLPEVTVELGGVAGCAVLLLDQQELSVRLQECVPTTDSPSIEPQPCYGEQPDLTCDTRTGSWIATNYTTTSAQSWNFANFRFLGDTRVTWPITIDSSSATFGGLLELRHSLTVISSVITGCEEGAIIFTEHADNGLVPIKLSACPSTSKKCRFDILFSSELPADKITLFNVPNENCSVDPFRPGSLSIRVAKNTTNHCCIWRKEGSNVNCYVSEQCDEETPVPTPADWGQAPAFQLVQHIGDILMEYGLDKINHRMKIKHNVSLITPVPVNRELVFTFSTDPSPDLDVVKSTVRSLIISVASYASKRIGNMQLRELKNPVSYSLAVEITEASAPSPVQPESQAFPYYWLILGILTLCVTVIAVVLVVTLRKKKSPTFRSIDDLDLLDEGGRGEDEALLRAEVSVDPDEYYD